MRWEGTAFLTKEEHELVSPTGKIWKAYFTENKLHKRKRKKTSTHWYMSILNIHSIELTVNFLPLLLWRDLGAFLFCSVVARMANGASLSLTALRMYLYFCREWGVSHCIRWWRIPLFQYPHGIVQCSLRQHYLHVLHWNNDKIWELYVYLGFLSCLITLMKGYAINLPLRQWVVLAITHYPVKDLAFQSMGNDVWSF